MSTTDTQPVARPRLLTRWSGELMQPHRLVLLVLFIAMLAAAIGLMNWSWLPEYLPALGRGIVITIGLLVFSVLLGYPLALLLGLARAFGPAPLSWPAHAFCTLIRGTPLLLQMWLLYFGLGAVFAFMPEIRGSWAWAYLRQGWPYGLLSLTFSFAGYHGEVLRGALAGVPKGELEAARAFGMSPLQVFRRVRFPRALQRSLPVLTGEIILQLKSTPLVATISVMDLYAVVTRVRQDSFLTYEPLLLVVAVYLVLSGILTLVLRLVEKRVPSA